MKYQNVTTTSFAGKPKTGFRSVGQNGAFVVGLVLLSLHAAQAQVSYGPAPLPNQSANRQPDISRGLPGRLGAPAVNSAAPMLPVIELQPGSALQGSIVRLGDVAAFRNMSENDAARLRDVALSPLPQDRPLVIDQQLIRNRLKACGFRPEILAIQGAAKSVVTFGTSSKSTRDSALQLASASSDPKGVQQVQELIRAVFERQFQAAAGESMAVDLQIQIHPTDVSMFHNVSADSIVITTPSLTMGGPQTIDVVVHHQGGIKSTVQLAAWLMPRRQNFVLKHAVPRGHIVQPQDLERVAAGPQGGLERLVEIVGKETLRPLRPAVPLQASDLTSIALIKPNDIVTVTARSGGISVRRQFKSSSSGALDESVTLTALDDPRERVIARVTGLHEAIIEVDSVGLAPSFKGADNGYSAARNEQGVRP